MDPEDEKRARLRYETVMQSFERKIATAIENKDLKELKKLRKWQKDFESSASAQTPSQAAPS